jgi:hypothetical protein
VIDNPSFEAPNTVPGVPGGWQRRGENTVTRAVFGDDPTEDFFAGWENDEYRTAFVLSEIALDNFENWVTGYRTTFVLAVWADDDFEDWFPYATEVVADSVAADDFEEGWHNDSYDAGFHSVFTPSGAPHDYFEKAFRPIDFIVDVAENHLIFAVEHGLPLNAVVFVRTTGTLPAPLQPDTPYLVDIAIVGGDVVPDRLILKYVDVTDPAYVDIIGVGTGTHTIYREPDYWQTFMD